MTVTNQAPKVPELELGDRLRITREKAGISREDMAAHFGKSVGALSHWETGRGEPRHMLDVVLLWAELTGYDYRWIAFGDSSNDVSLRYMPGWDDQLSLFDSEMALAS